MRERALWLLASMAGAILLMAAIWPRFEREDGAAVASASALIPNVLARVSVLNGCGDPQVAARMRKKAQSLGLDVIDEGNAESFDFLHSLVIDRGGDMEKARRVAALLGIPHCIQQVSDDDYRLDDIRIIVGKDYKRLRLLD